MERETALVVHLAVHLSTVVLSLPSTKRFHF
jgi:hypothetical protein